MPWRTEKALLLVSQSVLLAEVEIEPGNGLDIEMNGLSDEKRSTGLGFA